MTNFGRITHDPAVMDGKPRIRGMRVTVGMMGAGHTKARLFELYPYLESADIDQALTYAARRVNEREIALAGA